MKKLTIILLLLPVFINAQELDSLGRMWVNGSSVTPGVYQQKMRSFPAIPTVRWIGGKENVDTMWIDPIPSHNMITGAVRDSMLLPQKYWQNIAVDGWLEEWGYNIYLPTTDSLPDNSKTTTKTIRLPLANKDTFVTTVTTTDKTISYTTTSVVFDTATKKYVPPVVIPPATPTGQSLIKIDGWNSYVHLPAGYNTSGKTYPTIIFFPGLGEVGTNAALVINNGPGAYIKQDWNGNVTVDGATVEFIVISLQPATQYPNEVAINAKIAAIKSLYRVDPKRLYLTGLSHGGWCSSTFVTGDPLAGPYTYASQIAAVVEVQGVTPNDNTPYPDLFDNFVKSGGKFLGFEQRLDNRGVPTRVNRMNTTVPGSALYVQTNFGTGGHCCWNNFYGGGGLQPGNFSLGGVTQNLYQWMARQALKTTVPPAPSAGCNTDAPKTHIVLPTSPNEIYIKNASAKGWKGGDTLKIPAGTYSVIEIDSFGGDPCHKCFPHR